MNKTSRTALMLVAVAAAVPLASGTALADPVNAPNSFSFTGVCDNGQTVTLVVNSANGQGQGTQNNSKGQAVFTPGLVVGDQQVLHPVAFDLTFTFAPAEGGSFTFTQVATKKNQTATTTCQLSGSVTNLEGTFSIDGSVDGWFS